MNLKGKTAIVTGATGGLGWRICLALANEGANLCMVYRNSYDKANDQLRKLREMGCRAEIIQADITTDEGIDCMIESAVSAFGGIDMLILDAAYNEKIPFADLDTLDREKWNYIINYNLTAPYLAVRKAAPVMKKQGMGKIVAISSIGGMRPASSSIAYSVAKAGLNHLTTCLAAALAPEILVNAVAPGLLEGTRMTEKLDPVHIENARNTALLKRAVDKDDAAAAVVMFCKNDSITGQTLIVDSGRVFR